MKVTIIDYGSGNLHSAKKAFERANDELSLGADIILSSNVDDVVSADKIVLPGVGAFGDCYAGLSSIEGMVEVLNQQVLQKKKPFLGICVGMQLLAEKGFENGEHKGLGWLENSTVSMIQPGDRSLKIPHMGWNNLQIITHNKLTENISEKDDVYFVHSYAMKCPDKYIVATTDYSGKITAIVNKENIFGFQFHPEKSQTTGIELVKNFLKL